MKNYYEILGVEQDSDEDEIRKKYRKLAMQYHPDRNPDDKEAEERFKDIAEAYGVLTDPVKRKEYDSCLKWGRDPNGQFGQGFKYSQEDIFRDLFKDEQFQQMFQGLLREFQKSGFRANSKFIRHSFFGGKGGMIVGGLFLFGSLAGSSLLGEVKKKLPPKETMMKSLGRKVGSFLGGREAQQPQSVPTDTVDLDITYKIGLSGEELKQGKVVQVQTNSGGTVEVLKVRIPPESRAGQRLRLRGKGNELGDTRGDLYLHLQLSS